jgi:hypothetical protein
MNNSSGERLLLVGDNPFLNISHLSQSKARERLQDPSNPVFAASLLRLALENGANGFTFSVCDSNLSILDHLDLGGLSDVLGLYPVVPYAFEYVQKATQRGGISGLVKKLGWDMVKSGNLEALVYGVLTTLTANPVSLMKAYLGYELSRLDSYVSEKVRLESVLLHQLVTDLALALDMDWLFKEYVAFLSKKKITPGFNTGNFAYLVKKFDEWEIDLSKVFILAPFNNVGFQMTPSIEECESALRTLPAPVVIAISVLAAGFVRPKDAAAYIAGLPNIKGVAAGVSKEIHAKDTFRYFSKAFGLPEAGLSKQVFVIKAK